MFEYSYDANHTRFYLLKSVTGEKQFNWLFLPGGPGIDSSYLIGLIDQLSLPGHYWLVDLIFNGTNEDYPRASENIYHEWSRYLEDLVAQFDNAILVGHSFGGYLPFFCPALEQSLKGLVILNSVPTLQSDLFAQVATENNLPSLTPEKEKFVKEPNIENMKTLYLKEAAYFFDKQNLAKGIEEIINQLQYCIPTEHWWYAGGYAFFSEIQWIPQQIPTLIIGGEHDFITPLAVFEQDQRFHRKNIEMLNIPNAGHFPWLEQPALVNKTLEAFVNHG